METTINLNSINTDLYSKLIESPYSYNGYKVPRVTEVLSACMHHDAIVYWANNLGFKHINCRDEVKKAADYGTTVHLALEKYIKGEDIPVNTPSIPLTAFKEWWHHMKINYNINVIGQEFSMSCPWYGGTYDLLLTIDGKYWLVDFKTSNQIRYSYCLQLAAYMNMLIWNKIVPNLFGVMILRLLKKTPVVEQFVLSFDNPEHLDFMNQCSTTFNSIIFQYWNNIYLESKFNELKGHDTL